MGQGKKLGPDLGGVTKLRSGGALAEGAREDAADRRNREGDAQGVQQHPDAEPEPDRRGGQGVPQH